MFETISGLVFSVEFLLSWFLLSNGFFETFDSSCFVSNLSWTKRSRCEFVELLLLKVYRAKLFFKALNAILVNKLLCLYIQVLVLTGEIPTIHNPFCNKATYAERYFTESGGYPVAFLQCACSELSTIPMYDARTMPNGLLSKNHTRKSQILSGNLICFLRGLLSTSFYLENLIRKRIFDA